MESMLDQVLNNFWFFIYHSKNPRNSWSIKEYINFFDAILDKFYFIYYICLTATIYICDGQFFQ